MIKRFSIICLIFIFSLNGSNTISRSTKFFATLFTGIGIIYTYKKISGREKLTISNLNCRPDRGRVRQNKYTTDPLARDLPIYDIPVFYSSEYGDFRYAGQHTNIFYPPACQAIKTNNCVLCRGLRIKLGYGPNKSDLLIANTNDKSICDKIKINHEDLEKNKQSTEQAKERERELEFERAKKESDSRRSAYLRNIFR